MAAAFFAACGGAESFTKSSRGGHDLDAITLYADSVAKICNPSLISLSFFTTHSRQPRLRPGLSAVAASADGVGLPSHGFGSLQKIHGRVTILSHFYFIIHSYPGFKKISPISPSPLQHTQKKPQAEAWGFFCV